MFDERIPSIAPAERPRLTAASPGGFTLIELLVVLVLVGVIAGIMLPRVDVRRARVDTAALELQTRAMAAQRVAVVRQHDVRVLFDADDRSLIVHHDGDNDGALDDDERRVHHHLKEGVAFGQGDAPDLPYGSGPVSFSTDPDTGLPVLTYHRNGSASEEGVVYLTSRGGSAPENARAVHVLRATGQVSCWSHRTGEWTERC